MRAGRLQPIAEVKTGNSQQSGLDAFSKFEVGFLEKFFNYNLTDFFSEHLLNVYDDLLQRKLRIKQQKMIASSLFQVCKQVPLSHLEQQIQSFYKAKSKSLSEQELPEAFKQVYPGQQAQPVILNQGELLLVDVRLNVEVQKIQEAPQKIFKALQALEQTRKSNQSDILAVFEACKSKHLNIFYVYFGDINFGLFRKHKYQVETVKVGKKAFKVRMICFFVSKQALIQTFRSLNKVENMEYINDLVVQFYSMKREKHRRKRQKYEVQASKEASSLGIRHIFYGFVGVASLLTFGLAIKKIFD